MTGYGIIRQVDDRLEFLDAGTIFTEAERMPERLKRIFAGRSLGGTALAISFSKEGFEWVRFSSVGLVAAVWVLIFVVSIVIFPTLMLSWQ